MAKTGVVYVDVEAETKKFTTQLNAAAKRGGAEAGRTAGKAMSDSLGTNAKAFGTFTQTVAKARVGLGLFAFTAAPVAFELKKAADAASALNEQIAGAKQTFGASSSVVREFSKTTANAFGVAAAQALRAANAYGAFFKQAGFGLETSALFSKTLVQLAGDLASFKDVSVEQALDAISSGLAGESEPLRRLGVDLRQTKVDAVALANGFARTTAELTETDRVAGRFISLLQQTSDAQTDAARTAAEYANTQRRFKATLEDLRATGGQVLLPGLTDFTNGVTLLLAALSEGNVNRLKEAGIGFDDVFKAVGKGFQKGGLIGGGIVAFTELGKAGQDTGNKLDKAKALYKEAFDKFGSGSDQAKAAAQAFRAELDRAEATNRAYTQGMEDAATAANRFRNEQQQAIAQVQGFTSARRAEADAHKAVTDAKRAVGDAEDRLAELRRRGPIDAEKVADSERSLASATRSVADARRGLTEAEAELKRLRAGPTEDEAGDAERAVRRADLDLERAKRRLVEAQKAHRRAAKGSEKDEAALDLKDAELGLADAIDRQNGARKDQVDLLNRGKDGSKEMTEAKQRERDAQQQVADAIANEKEASDDLRKARAGDPQFAKDLAAAEREVAEAKERQARVEEDLPRVLAEARVAQQQFAADINATTAAAVALRDALMALGFGYLLPPGTSPVRPVGPPSAPGPVAGDDVRRPSTSTSTRSSSDPFGLGRASAPSGARVSIAVNAPIDAGTASQIELGARIASWQLGSDGRL